MKWTGLSFCVCVCLTLHGYFYVPILFLYVHLCDRTRPDLSSKPAMLKKKTTSKVKASLKHEVPVLSPFILEVYEMLLFLPRKSAYQENAGLGFKIY